MFENKLVKKILQEQYIFVVNRLLRFLFAMAFTILFIDNNLFSYFFILESLIPMISIIFAYFFSKILIFLIFIFLFISFFLYELTNLIIYIWLLFETFSSLVQFNLSRKHNQLIELFGIISLLFFLLICYVANQPLENFLYYMILISIIRIAITISISGLIQIKIPKYYFYSLPRQLTSTNFRFLLLGSNELSAFLVILYRFVNQVVLFVWSYLKSTSKFPIDLEFNKSKLLKYNFPLFVFSITNIFFVCIALKLLEFSFALLFSTFILITLYFLFFEISKSTRIQEKL